MVELKERPILYRQTKMETDIPSTFLVVVLSLVVICALGFLVYFLSELDKRSATGDFSSRRGYVSTPMPMPVSAPSIAVPSGSTDSGDSRSGK
jgi:hypothetical protein